MSRGRLHVFGKGPNGRWAEEQRRAQSVCATTTVFTATTAAPACVRARLSDDDGAM